MKSGKQPIKELSEAIIAVVYLMVLYWLTMLGGYIVFLAWPVWAFGVYCILTSQKATKPMKQFSFTALMLWLPLIMLQTSHVLDWGMAFFSISLLVALSINSQMHNKIEEKWPFTHMGIAALFLVDGVAALFFSLPYGFFEIFQSSISLEMELLSAGSLLPVVFWAAKICLAAIFVRALFDAVVLNIDVKSGMQANVGEWGRKWVRRMDWIVWASLLAALGIHWIGV